MASKAHIFRRFTADRPCGYSGFWMRIVMWASRRCVK
jgi:hypothetical protein